MAEPTQALSVVEATPLPVQTGIIRPLATPTEAREAWESFEALKHALLTDADRQQAQGRWFVKKSGWRKIAAAFGISLEVTNEQREDLEPSGFLWRLTVRATAPNGRYTDGVAGCASTERKFAHVQHDVYAQAYTRAANRAISDLVGGGEVSAEEMHAEAPAAPALPSFEQAQEMAAKCLDALVGENLEPLSLAEFRDLLAAVVAHGGDLRHAYRTYKAQHASEDAPAPTEVLHGEVVC